MNAASRTRMVDVVDVVDVWRNGRLLELDECLWSIAWSAALTPELSMIPDRSVFLYAPQGRSLTATIEGIPDLLSCVSSVTRRDEYCGCFCVNCGNKSDMVDDDSVVEVEKVEVADCYCSTHELYREGQVPRGLGSYK